MPLDIIMNLFSDLLIIIRDEFGNVIYPTDPQVLKYIDELKPIKSKQYNELVHHDSKRVYQILNTSYQDMLKLLIIKREKENYKLMKQLVLLLRKLLIKNLMNI